jgi:hypothetical protein
LTSSPTMSNYDIERIKAMLGTHADFPKEVCKTRRMTLILQTKI